jgi:hypothetical protein
MTNPKNSRATRFMLAGSALPMLALALAAAVPAAAQTAQASADETKGD